MIDIMDDNKRRSLCIHQEKGLAGERHYVQINDGMHSDSICCIYYATGYTIEWPSEAEPP